MSADSQRDRADLPIGVFDSGIGGLTVVRHILHRLPREGVVYFGDSARVPYGTKSAETVARFSREATRFLLGRGIKSLVVACNTSSAVAMNELQRAFSIPMVGVIEPAVRQAVGLTRSKRIGVIGTRATIASGAYDRALHELEHGIEVTSQACPLLVPLAEEGWLDGDVPERIVRHYLAPILAARIDVLILGCTHYPLLKSLIQDTVGPEVRVVESGEASVEEMSRWLDREQLRRASDTAPERRYYVSDIPLRFQEVGERFLGHPLGAVSRIEQTDLPWYER
ncbi:MAG: glutamate racemase [Candidatus Eisenbacteria bacterium]|nr:glutamate racemase [Candidatus Eisenbacteria bacterium]